MLGKRPRSLLRTSSKSQLMPSNGNECPSSPAVVEAKPVFGAPRHVVIGFDLGTENKKHQHGDVCESPRSVLEPIALCVPVNQQHSRSPRSPRSALASFLSGHNHRPCKEGVGIGIVAAIKAEDAKPEASKPSFKSEPVPVVGVNHLGPLQNQWLKQGPGHWACGGRRVRNPYPNPSEVMGDDHHDADDEMDIRESIFSIASPASNCCSLDFPAMDFLNMCFCKRPLAQGKDIYMYRGDRAFCSAECRYQQIVIDEHKERRSAAANCYS